MAPLQQLSKQEAGVLAFNRSEQPVVSACFVSQQRVRSCMIILSLAASEVQCLDVYMANNQFSRRCPGAPSFTVAVPSGSWIPAVPGTDGAAGLAAGSAPVRYASIERGDVAFYALVEMQLRSILRRQEG